MRRMILIVFLFFSTAALSNSWEDTSDYTERLASAFELQKSSPDSISLKSEWSFLDVKTDCVDIETDCCDRMRKLILDDERRPRIYYSRKNMGYNSYVIATVISMNDSQEYQDFLDENKEIEEIEEIEELAYFHLKYKMGEDLYRKLTIELNELLYYGGAAKGYTSYMETMVNSVVNWYGDHKEEMNCFLEVCKGKRAAQRLSEFLEMFVYDGGDFKLVEKICKSKSSGQEMAIILANNPGKDLLYSDNIYELWKDMKQSQ